MGGEIIRDAILNKFSILQLDTVNSQLYMAQPMQKVSGKSDKKAQGTSNELKLNENSNTFSHGNVQTSVSQDLRLLYYFMAFCVIRS